MKIALSPKERGAIFMVVNTGVTWGGDEVALLVRDEMYDTIDLAWFEDRQDEIAKLPDALTDYEVTREIAEHVVTTLCGSRLVAQLGRVAAKVVRRVREALADGKPGPAPILKLEPPAPGAG